MSPLRSRPLLLAATLLGFIPIQAWGARPPSRAFSGKELGSRGPIYGFAAGSVGLVAGSECLSIYDGQSWSQIVIPRARAFRALAAAPAYDTPQLQRGRVWVGGIGAIGYVEHDPQGVWNFVSVREQLEAEGIRAPGAVILATAHERMALFVGSHSVLRWDGRHFTNFPLSGTARLRACVGPDDNVWVWQEHVGLWQYGFTGEAHLLWSAADLPTSEVEWMLAGPETGGQKGAFIGTSDGAFLFQDHAFVRLADLSHALEGSQVTSAIATSGSAIALGTADRGIFWVTRQGQVSGHLDRDGGLRDSAVSSIWASPSQGIWAGLDDGFDEFLGNGTMSLISQPEGLTIGSPLNYYSAKTGDFAVTTKAIYRMSADESRTPEVVATSSRFNDAEASPEGLWVGGSGGLWLIGAQGPSRIMSTTDAVTSLTSIPDGTPGVIFIADYRLKQLRQVVGGQWEAVDLHQHFEDVPLSIATDAQGLVWVSTLSDGVYCFHLASSAVGELSIVGTDHFTSGKGLPVNCTQPRIAIIGKAIYLFTDQEILRWEDGKRWVSAPEFAGWIGLARSSGWRQSKVNTAFWVAQRRELGADSPNSLLRIEPGPSLSKPQIVVIDLPPGGVRGNDIFDIDLPADGTSAVVYIDRRKDFLRVEGSQGVEHAPTGIVTVRSVSAGNQRLSTQPLSKVTVGTSPASFHVRFAASSVAGIGPFFYQTRLIGADEEWSSIQTRGEADYSGLAPGTYDLEIRQIDSHGRAGGSTHYPFLVATPWYLTLPAQAGAVAILLIVAAYFVRRRVLHLQAEAEKLDRLVAERTHELQLSNSAKTELLETISHELRNPLNGILGLIDRMEQPSPAAVDGSLGNSLRDCAAGLARVFEEVLDFSRLESGQSVEKKEPFRLAEVLAAVIGLAREAAAASDTKVTVALPGESKDGFVGDPGRIRTIVSNFVDNALKYAPGQPIAIVATCDEQSDGKVQLLVEVCDGGPGVPDAEQELIFKKFVRGSRARASDTLGTGVGLAVCRSLARQMGGNVGIESPNDSGHGATFFLQLELVRAPSAANALTAGSPDWVGERVLIVDDRAYNQSALAGIMTSLGWSSTLASSSTQALSLIGHETFAAVLLDLDLASSSGFDLARQIRATDREGRLIILGTTGRSDPRIAARCLEAGMDAALTKPLSLERVQAGLAEAWTKRRLVTPSNE